MRLEFDQNVSVSEQLLRVAGYKEPGRKHQKRPGIRALERRKAAKIKRQKMHNVAHKKFKAKVAAYWNGELDCYPKVR